jgi:ABC-type Na+ transport system ATPase subunit NatA|nr:MAG TPA: minor capsid protein [Siphoviridae sp. ctoof1]
MRPYPFSPDLLDAMPEELTELLRALEITLLEEICSRLKASDQLNEVTVQDIRVLRSHGIDLKEIEKAIRKTSGISETKLNELLDDVVERNQKYYTELIDLAHITQPETLVSVEDTWAIYEQTKQTMRNITRSMGFLVDAGRTMLSPAKAYQWALDNATMQIQSGAISYNQAIKSAVRQLAQSGLKVVDYESGHRDQIDVAARRAVMTAVNQLNRKYSEQSMDFLQTDLVQVEAHAGARDIDGPKGWENHKKWQGKLYRWAEFTKKYPDASKGEYPDFESTCGIGDVTGILGANCRHSWSAFVEGVMERTYTDKQLEHIDDGLGCTFEGKTYTAYEATQMQRRVERTIRNLKREKAAYKAAGLTEKERAVNIRLRRLNAKYKAFSEAAGLPEQWERTKMQY